MTVTISRSEQPRPSIVDWSESAPATPSPLRWRLTAYPIAFLAVLAVSFVIVVGSGSGSSTVGGRIGGDFPAFYSAGTLVANGHIDSLYDPVAQASVQSDLLGSERGFLAFAYAPHVALAYAPLSLVGYRLAYVIHTSLMVAALVAALWMMRPMIGIIDRWFALAVAASIGFYPMFIAVGGGQNTAISLLLLVWLWRSLRDGNDLRAGLAVALLVFRPQYALPVLGLLFLGRHLKAVGWAVVGISATWLVDAVLLGPSWFTDWLHSVGPFVSKDADVNGHNAVAVVGFLQSLMGTDSAIAIGLGALGSIAVAGVLAQAWRSRNHGLDHLMAMTAAGLVLLSPHTMFYDAGLIVISLAVLADRPSSRWRLVVVVSGLALLQTASTVLGFSPFAPVVAGIFVMSIPADRNRMNRSDRTLMAAC